MTDEYIGFRIDSSTKRSWQEAVDESAEYRSLTHLICLAVEDELRDGDGADASAAEVDVDLSRFHDRFDAIQRQLDTIEDRADDIYVLTRDDQSAEIMEIVGEVLDLVPEPEDVERPAVLGHSMGGMVSYAFADAHPEKLSALIAVGAMTPESFSTREWGFKTAHARVITPLLGNKRVLNAVIWAQQKLFGDDSIVDVNELEQLRVGHECDMPELSPSERSKILHAAQEYFASNWSWQIAETPVLLLYGENDPFIEAHADYLETQLADCQTAEIPEASHNAHVDNPEFVCRRVREFLDEVTDERAQMATNQ